MPGLYMSPKSAAFLEICGAYAGMKISPVGVGAWSWGDRTGLFASAHTDATHFTPCFAQTHAQLAGYWGYGNEYQKADNLEAYKAVVGNGISFIDTSEVRYRF